MLRGTARKHERKVFNQRPTLQNQITALRRQVNQAKPETQYMRIQGNKYNPNDLVHITNYNITQTLVNLTNFRDNVTGDQWRNLFLKLHLNIANTNKLFRVMLYVPRTVGERFSPSSNEFVSIPDQSSYWVIYDRILNDRDVNGYHHLQKTLSLRNLKTIYDSNKASIEKGEIVLSIITQGTTNASTLQYDYAYELGYQNI